MRLPVGALVLLGLVAIFWAFEIALGDGRGRGFGDIHFYYYPLYEAAYSRIFDEPLSLWNPYELCGIPWLATLQGGLLYPPHLLYTLLPTSYALAASSLLHLCFIALSTAALARRVGLSRYALLVAVTLATLSSRYASMLLTPNTLEAASWLPLGAFAVVGLVRGSLGRSAALLAVCLAASILAGYPQATVYCVYAWGALWLILAGSERPSLRSGAVKLAGFLGALVMGTLLAGIQLLPSLELAREGTRSLDTLSSGLFSVYPAPNTIVRPGWGLLAAALFPAALLGRRHRALGFAAVFLCVTTLFFSWGLRTSAYELYLSLPLLDAFRFPHRILFVTDFFFALAAAIGLDALLDSLAFDEGATEKQGWLRNGWSSRRSVVSLAVGAAAFTLATRALAPVALLGFACMAVASLSAFLVLRKLGPVTASAATAVALTLTGVLVVESYTAPRKSWDLPYAQGRYPAASMQPHPQLQAIASRGERVIFLNSGRWPPVFPKLATVHRVRAANGYEPMNLRRQADYFSFFMGGTGEVARSLKPFDGTLFRKTGLDLNGLGDRRRLLDLAAVRFVLTTGREKDARLAAFVEGIGAKRVGRIGERVEVFENESALPRAFVTYDVRPAPATPQLLALLSDPKFDPLLSSYVHDESDLQSGGGPRRGAPARIVLDTPQAVEIEASLEADGLLVLADTYYPGWYASVDGEPAEILRTNHLFRGVRVPAGSHRVRFEYRPWSVWVGLLVSGVGAACVLATWHRGSRGKKRSWRVGGNADA